jgi:hypothetical protein
MCPIVPCITSRVCQHSTTGEATLFRCALYSKQPTYQRVLLWDNTKLVNCRCAYGAFNANYSRQLVKAIGRVDGLVTNDGEVRKLVLLGWGSLAKQDQDDSSCE